jgi:NAD-dependent deacetylase
MEVAHISVFRREPERFWHFYGNRFSSLRDKRPNAAHLALAELERRGLVETVVTQNIDGLHRAAGTQDLIEVHGSIGTSSCLECGRSYELADVRGRLVTAPDGVPRCECGAPLKPDVVLFGELLPEAALSRASELASSADLLLCIGSSLEVYPVAELPRIALASGGRVALVTKGPTPYDRDAAVKLDGDVVAELEAVLAALA